MKRKVFLQGGVILCLSVLFVLSCLTLSYGDEANAGVAGALYDESATAESLGLEPLVLPDDFYPVYMWDHDWARTYATIEESLTGMAECELTTSCFVRAEDVPLCERLGLKCMVEIGVDCHGFKEKPAEEIESLFRPVIESTRESEAVIGYYLIDEPGADEFAGLAKCVAAVKKLAPGKFAYINLFPGYASKLGVDAVSQLQTHTYTEYLERFVQEVRPQCLSYDNYLVEYSEDMANAELGAGYYKDLLEVRRVARKYKIPFWNIVSSMSITDSSTPPNVSRLAFQAYTSLAAGAEGLGWFLYYPVMGSYTPVGKDKERTIIWEYLRVVNKQVRVLGTVLNRYETTGVFFSEATVGAELPVMPGQVVTELNAEYSHVVDPGKRPTCMLGEFRAKEGQGLAFMIVNLDFSHSVKVDPKLAAEGRSLQVVSPITGSVSGERPSSGWWILPGHGMLFIVE
ncbi:MAG: hypothetical protein Q4G68_11995 [Planctomycetia bacterium]|nr:hypothetical protein [Planctomycetia bacterium]